MEEPSGDEEYYFDANQEASTTSLYTSRPPISGPSNSRKAPANPVTIPSQNTVVSQSVPPTPSDYVPVGKHDFESIPPPPSHTVQTPSITPPPDNTATPQSDLPQVSSLPRNTETSVTDSSTPSRSETFDTEASRGKVVEAPPKERRQNPGKMTGEQLKATWLRVGIQVYEGVIELFEKSEKTVVGDGTYVGFVNAVLERVINASTVEPDASSFGYPIYVQKGPTVIWRVADIMPGDIIVLQDAKLKGFKGLKTYLQRIGEGTPVVGIIIEHKSRKCSVKVYQACKQAGNRVRHTINHVSTILMHPFSPSSLSLTSWKI